MPGDPREIVVGHDHVDPALAEDLEGLRRIAGPRRVEARQLEGPEHGRAQGRMILDQEYPRMLRGHWGID
jgi:hypothetical protein